MRGRRRQRAGWMIGGSRCRCVGSPLDRTGTQRSRRPHDRCRSCVITRSRGWVPRSGSAGDSSGGLPAPVWLGADPDPRVEWRGHRERGHPAQQRRLGGEDLNCSLSRRRLVTLLPGSADHAQALCEHLQRWRLPVNQRLARRRGVRYRGGRSAPAGPRAAARNRGGGRGRPRRRLSASAASGR
jgi:hypothetical protein